MYFNHNNRNLNAPGGSGCQEYGMGTFSARKSSHRCFIRALKRSIEDRGGALCVSWDNPEIWNDTIDDGAKPWA